MIRRILSSTKCGAVAASAGSLEFVASVISYERGVGGIRQRVRPALRGRTDPGPRVGAGILDHRPEGGEAGAGVVEDREQVDDVGK
jgi:hypothetical protein